MRLYVFNSLLVSNNLHIMENTKFIFTGGNYSDGQELQLYCNDSNEIFIKIYHWETPEHAEFITLNKETSAKLSKVLKREISKIEDNE